MDAVTAGLAGAVFPALFPAIPPIDEEVVLGPGFAVAREWFETRHRCIRQEGVELDAWFAHRDHTSCWNVATHDLGPHSAADAYGRERRAAVVCTSFIDILGSSEQDAGRTRTSPTH